MDRKKWDFWLLIVTVILFFSLAFLSLLGTFYSWGKSISNPNWSSSFQYQSYLKKMNLLAAPLALGILALLGLCIPKRLSKVSSLVFLTLFSFGVFFLASFLYSWKSGLLVFVILLSLIEVLFIFFYLFKKGIFHFEKKGFYDELGSLLSHLGFTLLVLNFILGYALLKVIYLFWITFSLILIGLIFSFFSDEFSKLFSSGS